MLECRANSDSTFGGGCPANFIAGEKLSALAGMHRVCRDPKFLGSARPAFGYNLASYHNRSANNNFYNNFFRNIVRIA
jgi:hypothetical protein